MKTFEFPEPSQKQDLFLTADIYGTSTKNRCCINRILYGIAIGRGRLGSTGNHIHRLNSLTVLSGKILTESLLIT